MRYISRYFLNLFDGQMTLNASDKKFLKQKWHVKNIHFIPSGIRVERFLNLKRKSHPTLNFLTVGSYRTSQKGIDLALKAIELFNSRNQKNKAIFNFVGGGTTPKNSNIKELGYVKYENMPKIYEQNDIYLLSSREEPFGLVLIEAWSSGMPVLATKTEGPLDMLKEGKNGWFISQINPQSITLSIEKLYLSWQKNNDFPLQYEENCRQTGKQFSIDETAKSMRKLFTT